MSATPTTTTTTTATEAQEPQKRNFSEDEIKELREIFCLVDLDGGGTISKDELASLMVKMGLEASKAELANLVNEIDLQGTGEIDFESIPLIRMYVMSL